MIPFTLSTASTCLFAASTAVIARALYRSIPSGAFFGQNPFVIKAGMYARAEATAGLVLVVMALILGLVSEAHPAMGFANPPKGMWEPNLLAGLILALGTVLVAIWVADRIQRPRIRAKMLESQRGAWERDHFVLTHGGRYPHEEATIDLPDATRRLRLESAQGTISQIEALLDLRAIKDDAMEARLTRIEQLFSKQTH